MSDFDKNNEQGAIWTSGVNNVRHGFSGNQKDEHSPNPQEETKETKEVTRQSLEDMSAIAGRSQVKAKTTGFGSSQSMKDAASGIEISPERLESVSKDMKIFLNAKPEIMTKATALADVAFSSAAQKNDINAYAKAAVIQNASVMEFAD